MLVDIFIIPFLMELEPKCIIIVTALVTFDLMVAETIVILAIYICIMMVIDSNVNETQSFSVNEVLAIGNIDINGILKSMKPHTIMAYIKIFESLLHVKTINLLIKKDGKKYESIIPYSN